VNWELHCLRARRRARRLAPADDDPAPTPSGARPSGRLLVGPLVPAAPTPSRAPWPSGQEGPPARDGSVPGGTASSRRCLVADERTSWSAATRWVRSPRRRSTRRAGARRRSRPGATSRRRAR
jgi:hypothetical protein